MVRMTGFEPARVSPLTPEISVSTSFTTSAMLFYNSRFSYFVHHNIKIRHTNLFFDNGVLV